MPRTRMSALRPYTTRFFNPISRPVAGWLPGLGIVSYRGRKTGRAYRTPINVFRRDGDFIFALTYGSEVNWVQNILAAGECELTTRGRTYHLVEPQVFVDPTRHLMPWPIRMILSFNRVTEFLRMRQRAN
jgi:deazaflavin-dependent oxidoreductase (nitroreductase family)